MMGLMRVMVAVKDIVLFNVPERSLIEEVMNPMRRRRDAEKEKGNGKQKTACAPAT